MDTQKLINAKINKLDEEFKELVKDENLNINVIENLSMSTVEECKQIINNHIEKLIMSEIDEKKLIDKKNKNGTKKAIN